MKINVSGLAGVLLIGVLMAGLGVIIFNELDNEVYAPQLSTEAQTTQTTEPIPIEALKRFDLVGDGYHLLYEEIALPNTLEQVSPPEITGNIAADEHIREMAKERGYELQRVILSEEELAPIDDVHKLQHRAQIDWKEMVKEAEQDGIFLGAVSAYRSVDEQRGLFLAKLTSLGVVTSEIYSGSQDKLLDQALTRVAPPGYSRHHTGYTVDVKSADSSVFAHSKGFDWMSKDNYTAALKHGFIPSYPEGAIVQGPEPEPWEFVWVGVDLIESQIKP